MLGIELGFSITIPSQTENLSQCSGRQTSLKVRATEVLSLEKTKIKEKSSFFTDNTRTINFIIIILFCMLLHEVRNGVPLQTWGQYHQE